MITHADGYIYGAYAIAYGLLLGYGLTLWRNKRRLRQAARAEAVRTP